MRIWNEEKLVVSLRQALPLAFGPFIDCLGSYRVMARQTRRDSWMLFTYMWDFQLNMGSAVSLAGLLSALLRGEGLFRVGCLHFLGLIPQD